MTKHFGRFWFGLAMLMGIGLVIETSKVEEFDLPGVVGRLLFVLIVFVFLYLSTQEEW
jgi:succinate-acetate transporter protein